MIECPICNNKYKSLQSHLRKHGTSAEDFRKKYPNCPIASEETKNKVSATNKRVGVGKWRAGHKASEETKIKMSITRMGENNGFYGKKHSEKTRKRMSENHADFTGENNPFKNWVKVPENRKSYIQSIEAGHTKRRQENSPEYVKFCEENSERVAKLHIDGKLVSYGRGHKNGYFKSIRQGTNIYYRSSYENRFLNVCENIETLCFKPCNFYIPYNVNNKKKNYIPDFILNNNLVIEIKPTTLLNYGNNKLKFEAGEKYCINNNMRYIIITEKDIVKMEKNKECLIDLLTKK